MLSLFIAYGAVAGLIKIAYRDYGRNDNVDCYHEK